MVNRTTEPQPSAGRRGDILGSLRRAARPLTITELADQLGVHPNTVRFHLDTLIANGQVERVGAGARGPGRPPQLFQAVAGMDPAGARHYQLLAEILADTLTEDPDPAGRVVEAGRSWGRQHGTSPEPAPPEPGQAVARLVGLLEELDFAPDGGPTDDEPSAEVASRIELRNCPFLEVARTRPQVACPLHLGLMQGAMDAWHSPVTVDRLDPFVEPDRCVAHLAAAPAMRHDREQHTPTLRGDEATIGPRPAR